MVETAWVISHRRTECSAETIPTEISDPVPNQHALEVDRRLLFLDERLVAGDNSGREEREVSTLTRMNQYQRRRSPSAIRRM
jgi:hypothetical protein